jgi:hypothetical protein
MAQLEARGNPNPKLALAQSLDIPSEPRWLGGVATQRNTPRHRVIARFARERLWDQIWSLNWDCVQESAFENVGIKHNAPDANLPWPTTYNTFITAADCAQRIFWEFSGWVEAERQEAFRVKTSGRA